MDGRLDADSLLGVIAREMKGSASKAKGGADASGRKGGTDKGKTAKGGAAVKSKAKTSAPRGTEPGSVRAQMEALSTTESWLGRGLGHWRLAEGVELPQAVPLGFVYKITRREDGKFYWGQKKVVAVETRAPLKGKKRRRRFLRQTDWREYCGSSSELAADIARYGEKAFDFAIHMFVETKWELSYWELWHQMHDQVLFRRDSYNGIINVRLSKFERFVEKGVPVTRD